MASSWLVLGSLIGLSAPRSASRFWLSLPFGAALSWIPGLFDILFNAASRYQALSRNWKWPSSQQKHRMRETAKSRWTFSFPPVRRRGGGGRICGGSAAPPPPQQSCAGPGLLWAELIMSCQRFCWQVFIYQAVTFQRTRQSCSRYEGQQESRILIKDQAAKNKTGPAGTSPRLEGDARGVHALHVLIITHRLGACCSA